MEVRTRHCAAARKARKAGFGPISQLDMVLTQFGFMGFGLLVPEKLGLTGSPEEQEGFIHFWRRFSRQTAYTTVFPEDFNIII